MCRALEQMRNETAAITREETRKETLTEVIHNMVSNNISIDSIASILNLPPEEVQELYQA